MYRPWLVAIAPLPVNKFPNILALNISNSLLKNPLFCSFASFLIVSLSPFIIKPDSSSDLTIYIIPFICSFETINVVTCEAKHEGWPDQNIFLWIAASVADVAAVNPNGIKMLLANSLSKFHIKGNPVFSNGPTNLPKNPPDCLILRNWVFDQFILALKPFANVLRSLS